MLGRKSELNEYDDSEYRTRGRTRSCYIEARNGEEFSIHVMAYEYMKPRSGVVDLKVEVIVDGSITTSKT